MSPTSRILHHEGGGAAIDCGQPIPHGPNHGLTFGLLEGLVQTRLPAPPEQHVIYQLSTTQADGLREYPNGSTVSFHKRRGAITIAPAGKVVPMWLLAPATFISCALDNAHVLSVIEELDTPCVVSPVFASGLHDRSIEILLQLLRSELASGSPSGSFYSDSLSHALAVRFILSGQEHLKPSTGIESGLPQHITKRVKDRIEANLGHSLNLEELASVSGYSRAHFLRMFRKTVGQTPHRYVLDRRIAQAQRMLKDGQDSLVEISFACGFSSQAHMSASFRKLLDTTPAQYRKTS